MIDLAHNVEPDLNALEKSRDEALRALDAVLFLCGHDLRTPLTSMKLQIEVLRRNVVRRAPATLTPEKIETMLEQLNRQLDRLSHIIDQIPKVAHFHPR